MKCLDWKMIVFASALLSAGCATAPGAGPASGAGPGAKGFKDFPCLSYSMPCGKIATRAPVKKQLEGPLSGDAARGKAVATARNQGNCIACHKLRDGDQPGTRGPDLSRYGSLGRSDADTYAMIYDMRTVVPDTVMPPIGTNAVLSDQEIRDIVVYLQASK